MHVALTGTPGTGKSTVASILQKQGYIIVRLHDVIKQAGCVTGIDEKRNSNLVDTVALNRYITKKYKKDETVFFEGHLAHLLRTMEKILILRCHPDVLKKRLEKKRWKAHKIQENLDAETLDVILCEAVERHPKKNIFEIDTTKRTVQEVAASISSIAQNRFQPTKTYSIGQIDWSEELLKYPPNRSSRYGIG